jgi:hypothetical protein
MDEKKQAAQLLGQEAGGTIDRPCSAIYGAAAMLRTP